MVDVHPDARKSLEKLHEEWEGCQKCDLGVRRNTVGGSFVFGEGAPGGIMFIGEGPGVEEEAEGRPFIGKSGQVLRHAITRLGIPNFYITNAVSCRSCAQAYNSEGQPLYRTNRQGVQMPVIRDETPNPAQVVACLPRLYQEIYAVDPVLIVALGGAAAEALTHKAVSIQTESGKTTTIKVPGASSRALLTEKKQTWVRRVKGELLLPTAQNDVEYLMLPILHPAFVIRKKSDARWMNPVQVFANGMKKAAMLYDRYMREVYGAPTPQRTLEETDIQEFCNG